jgi:hypothetical protein
MLLRLSSRFQQQRLDEFTHRRCPRRVFVKTAIRADAMAKGDVEIKMTHRLE